MNLLDACISFLASPTSLDLRAEIHDRVIRLILASEGVAPVNRMREVEWADPRIAPHVDVPHKFIEKLERLSAQGCREMPVAPQAMVHRLKVEALRKWLRLKGRELPEENAVGFAVELAESAFERGERDDLFVHLLRDVKGFVSTFKSEDRLLTYFRMPGVHGAFAYLLVSYSVCTIAELAEEVGRSEAEAIELMSSDSSLTERLAQGTGRSRKSVEARSARMRDAIRLFGQQLPYVVELCRMIRN